MRPFGFFSSVCAHLYTYKYALVKWNSFPIFRYVIMQKSKEIEWNTAYGF